MITNETIRQCILGLDVLSACPITKPIIQTLRGSLRFCTKFLQAEQNANQIDSTTDNSFTTEQNSASEKQQATIQDYMQVNHFKFSKEDNAYKHNRAQRDEPSISRPSINKDQATNYLELDEMTESEDGVSITSGDDYESDEYVFESSHVQVMNRVLDEAESKQACELDVVFLAQNSSAGSTQPCDFDVVSQAQGELDVVSLAQDHSVVSLTQPERTEEGRLDKAEFDSHSQQNSIK